MTTLHSHSETTGRHALEVYLTPGDLYCSYRIGEDRGERGIYWFPGSGGWGSAEQALEVGRKEIQRRVDLDAIQAQREEFDRVWDRNERADREFFADREC